MIGFDLWRSYGGEREGYREVDNTPGFSEAGGALGSRERYFSGVLAAAPARV
jgi:hypothetical protein